MRNIFYRHWFKNTSLLFLSLTLGVLVVAAPALAADATDEVAAAAGLGGNDLLSTVGTVISVVLGILGIVFLLLLIYAGWMWMTAGGNEERVKKAKRTLINAVVGLVLCLAAYGIATFVINALSDATGTGRTGGDNGSVDIERLSGSLGSGPIQDHYPARNAADVARNTLVIVTFKDSIDPESLIAGYDNSGTPGDVTDDVATTTINDANIKIYPTAEGAGAAVRTASVAFTEDLKTFTFDPDEYLGSATADTSYTVFLDDILNTNGDSIFTGSYEGGYEWSFEVGTTVDLTPPTVTSAQPAAGGTYDRNITVEITFSEAMDPTTTTGTRAATSGFDNIQVVAASSGAPTAGTYVISNGYRTVTFTSAESCGTNSCGETMYCLAGGESITSTISASVTDVSANALDGNGDGTAGDAYSWSFLTTNDINLVGPTITAINPNILSEGVALDQDVSLTFDSPMMTSTLTSNNIALTNREVTSGESHELWYSVSSQGLAADGTTVTSASQTVAATLARLTHGVFLESKDGLTYMYGVTVGSGVKNNYQNCYSPAEGPTITGDACAVDSSSPSCCNGDPSSTACTLFP